MRIYACKSTEIGAVTHTGANPIGCACCAKGTWHTDQQRHGGNRHCFQYVHCKYPSPLAGGFARLAIHVSIDEAARILRETRYPEQ